MKIITNDFALTELETLDQPRIYVASDELTQTLARLMAYDRSGKLWRMLECDANGRLILSQTTGLPTTFTASTTTITGNVQLFPTQNNRLRVTFHNVSSNVIRLASSISGLPNGFRLLSGATVEYVSIAAIYASANVASDLSYIAYYL